MFSLIRELSLLHHSDNPYASIYVSPSGTTLVVGPHAILRDGDCRTSPAVEWLKAENQSQGATCLDSSNHASGQAVTSPSAVNTQAQMSPTSGPYGY
jgi:hypothetical protein